MFDKESKEYGLENYRNYDDYPYVLTDEKAITKAFQKGAEFGYNKVNEWHKVADGDIPENERWVCNQDGCYCYYDIDTEQWLDLEGTRTRTIEWCDMPTKEIE